MAEERSYSQRSMEEAAQRRADKDYGYRTGVGYNDAAQAGVREREAVRRNQAELAQQWRLTQTKPRWFDSEKRKRGSSTTPAPVPIPLPTTRLRRQGAVLGTTQGLMGHMGALLDAIPSGIVVSFLAFLFVVGLTVPLQMGLSLGQSVAIATGVVLAPVAFVALVAFVIAAVLALVAKTWKWVLGIGVFWFIGWMQQQGYF